MSGTTITTPEFTPDQGVNLRAGHAGAGIRIGWILAALLVAGAAAAMPATAQEPAAQAPSPPADRAPAPQPSASSNARDPGSVRAEPGKGAEPQGEEPDPQGDPGTDAGPIFEPAPLVIWNREITIFRAPVGQLSPKQRAEAAAQRITNLPATHESGKVISFHARMGEYEGSLVTVDGYLLFGLLKEDLDPLGAETVEEAAAAAAARVQNLLAARKAQRSLPLLLRGIAMAAGATAVFLLVIWLLVRARRFLHRILSDVTAHRARIEILEFDLRELALVIGGRAIGLLFLAVLLGTGYVWLTRVLSHFPYTQPWSAALGGYLIASISWIASGVLDAVPGVATVLVIVVVMWFFIRAVRNLFQGVEQGVITVSWLEPETARATRQLATFAILLFTLTVAYPFIPGSDTDAFKGVTVFAGLMISLGSAGVINQVVSGFVAIYSRAVRRGDFVRIGEVEGIVTELGVLSTKIVTLRREEMTIPNSVLVGSVTTNYSRLVGGDGAVIGTTVTIGYDAPWRQVHALLLLAAERAEGVRKSPAPRVMQRALSDFFVEYTLLVNIDRPEDRFRVLSGLHAHIQDAFNEYGVQIMSPHFEAQPDRTIVVPRAKWHERPAEGPQGKTNG